MCLCLWNLFTFCLSSLLRVSFFLRQLLTSMVILSMKLFFVFMLQTVVNNYGYSVYGVIFCLHAAMNHHYDSISLWFVFTFCLFWLWRVLLFLMIVLCVRQYKQLLTSMVILLMELFFVSMPRWITTKILFRYECDVSRD
jgi:hypothetical protein